MAKNIKTEKRDRAKSKIKAKIKGVSLRPRLSVFRSNKHIYAQIIDDMKNITLAQANDSAISTGKKGEKAEKVGELIAVAAQNKKIDQVVFDRNGFKYAGRIKLLAEAARKAGLKF